MEIKREKKEQTKQKENRDTKLKDRVTIGKPTCESSTRSPIPASGDR